MASSRPGNGEGDGGNTVFRMGARLRLAFNRAGNSRIESRQLPENSLWHLWIFQIIRVEKPGTLWLTRDIYLRQWWEAG